jgi:sister chromatid cohesion protein DCC1
MKAVDTSNTMLICPGLSTPDGMSVDGNEFEETGVRQLQVAASVNSYYELRSCRPRISKLKQILKSTAYCGPEEDHHTHLYSLDDLLGTVQASESELLKALQEFGAFQVNGRWRVLDVQYQEGTVMAILNALDEKMWSHTAIPLSECCTVLGDLYPDFVVKHCLELYGEKCSFADDTYCLSELKICQFYAEYLLRPVDRFCFNDFLESWQQSVPSGMTTSIQQLKGLALWDLDARPPVIWHFSVKDLPEDPAERFAKLFRARSKWTLDELEPFISDLGTKKVSASALLLKFARVSTDKLGRKVYNSKQPL